MSGTILILLLTIPISLLGLKSPAFIQAMILRPYRVLRGADLWTLLTSGFVHADLGHLLLNLLTFYSFGPSLEHQIGTSRFLLLYLCGLLVSGLGTCFKHRNEPHYGSLGASGAILAVLFASVVYFPHQSILILPLPIPIPAPLFALGYLAFSYYSARRAQAPEPMAPMPPGTVPAAEVTAPGQPPPVSPVPPLMRPRDRINHDAHIFGALTGLAFVALENPERFQGLLQLLSGR